ncbi:FAD-dependent oxidoreductase [Geodermatophilus nigrescens]|uniref:FAD dependent oxidoreductase n=1 Tax=Geodermatophilus nigrescens TaxID=1070870 RepID=A0A1M5M027_9ACTN|nr:FAD-dependent oxidoreductase [Geodermatophilus nigrescens]SHG70631.1 FAD dependent oxidoreductase [Geodermatophilus nigrescens]
MTSVGIPRSTDVVVVGGGATGSAAAWWLARRGVGVVLLERVGPGYRPGTPRGRVDPALVAEGRRLWAELGQEAGQQMDPGTAVTVLQDAAAAHGAVIGHHRRVTAVLPDGDGVRARQAAGADVHARVAVVTAGDRTPALLGPGFLLPDRVSPVVLRRVVVGPAGGCGLVGAPAVGRVLADLALGQPGIPVPALTA